MEVRHKRRKEGIIEYKAASRNLFFICESHSVVYDSLQPHGLYRPCNPPGQSTGVGSLFLLQGTLPNPGIKHRSPALQADSLPSEPPGNPKNTGVGSLSLLQGIFPTQESNRGLLHCRWILYQLGHKGTFNFQLVAIKKTSKMPQN